MRTSEAGLALVRRARPGEAAEYLAQWSDTWRQLSLVGGHVEPGESLRDCCVREVEEELGLVAGTDFRVAAAPAAPACEYRAVSGSAGVETRYRIELYPTELLTPRAAAAVAADPANRWLTLPEIRRGAAADGRPVSAQVETVLRLAGVIPDRPRAPRGSTVPTVVWTHRAERRLQDHLIRAEGSAAGLARTLADYDGRLAAAFPGATAVLALDVYAGFRPRPGEVILRVDVRDDREPGTYIVKLAADERLAQELGAWAACRPVGFRADAVFMALEPLYRADAPGRLAALAYQDAGPHIGVDEVIPLEVAALRAVRLGSPDLRSVLQVLDGLFAQLGRVLYTATRPAGPDAGGVALNPHRGGPRRRLTAALARWETAADAVDVRQQVGAAFPPGCDRYLDPVDYARFLEAEVAAGTPPDRVLPHTLRGRAHGDLHGRNVLVGVEDNQAGSPALFDYEHASCDNLVGWDFVKLETELKVRAAAALHPTGTVAEFAAAVEAFETRVAAATRDAHETGVWLDGVASDATRVGWDRLAAVVLAVRRHAATHLGLRPNRVHEWLREYDFLLTCYGLTTAGFENQTPRERAAALVSAGVAAVQYERTRPGGAA